MISSALSRSIRPAIRHNLFRTPTNTRAINFEASHLNVSSLADPSCCEIIENSSDPRLEEVYHLRYNVARKIMHLPRSHPVVYEQAHGNYGVKDALDDEESTVHFAVRNPNNGKVIAAIRTVDANKSVLEMEKYNWHNLSQEIKDEGVVEWCRLCADPSARGSSAAPMLYIQSVRYHQALGNCNFTFMVDQKATKLLKYYNNWTIAEQLTNAPVRCDEFEPGRKSYVMNMPMGKPGTLARAKFQSHVYYPAILGTCFMKSYRSLPAVVPAVA